MYNIYVCVHRFSSASSRTLVGPTTSLVSRSSSNELATEAGSLRRPLPLRHPSYHSIRTGSSSSNNTSRCYQSIDRSFSFNEADHRRASVRWNEASISRQSSTASHPHPTQQRRSRRRRYSLRDPTEDDDDGDDINEINQLSSVDSAGGGPSSSAAGGLVLQKSMSSGATQGAQSWKKLRAVMAYYCSLRKIKRNGSNVIYYTLLFSMYSFTFRSFFYTPVLFRYPL